MLGNGNPVPQGDVLGPGTKDLRWCSSDNYLGVLLICLSSKLDFIFVLYHVIILSRILNGDRVV